MSRMKDFSLWLEQRGHAVYDSYTGEYRYIDADGTPIEDPVQNTELVEQYRKDVDWHGDSK